MIFNIKKINVDLIQDTIVFFLYEIFYQFNVNLVEYKSRGGENW
jgi:hypothetical protein